MRFWNEEIRGGIGKHICFSIVRVYNHAIQFKALWV